MFSDGAISLEPIGPWSLPAIGLTAMLGTAALLAALTVWTYLGVQRPSWRRVLIVLILRLIALAVIFLMMLRPSIAMTQLEGVEVSKLLVVMDASASMAVADIDGKPTRWEQVQKIWTSPQVQRRIKSLAVEQKVEVVKYLAAEDLRHDEPDAAPTGKRTEIGAWLHQLWQKHGSEKHLRGVVLFSDGAENGTRFSAQEKARLWRGIAPIHAFGVGDPQNARFKKNIGLTRLDVNPSPVSVKSEVEVEAVAQAPGFENAKIDFTVTFENLATKKSQSFHEMKGFQVRKEKDQRIVVKGTAPDEPGEYKVTMRIASHADEVNKENNEISTYVQVIKSKINVLWVDRFRAWEPQQAIRAIVEDPRFAVHFFTVPAKNAGDPIRHFEFDQRHYDVIVLGDISAKLVSFGKPEIFTTITKMVLEKNTGLLMLGGGDTFCNGGWSAYPDFMNLLPVKFNKAGKEGEFDTREVQPVPTRDGEDHPFLRFKVDRKANVAFWNEKFELLRGIAPVGDLADKASVLLEADKTMVMAKSGVSSAGRVVVFAGDSTHASWCTDAETVAAYKHFWKNLIFWLAKEEDAENQLWVKLDRRRITSEGNESLGFTFGLKGKKGEVLDARFTAKVVSEKDKKEFPVTFVKRGDHQQGSFQGAKDAGEYRLVLEGVAGDVKANAIARFLVATDDIETLRPAAEHETLNRIAANSEGRFHVAGEQQFIQYLDEVRESAIRDGRQKTVYWPDWKRVPASEAARDQLPGLWHSFAIFGLLLFVGLVGAEWGLRRWWGMV